MLHAVDKTPLWTGPVILTLCISLLALAVSGGSLWWQISSWQRSGPRVKVRATSGVGGTVPPVWFVGIEATNSGRLATEIEQFGFQLPNGRHVQNIYDPWGNPVQLPMPVGPGKTATMMYAAEHIRQLLRQEGITGEDVRPYAKTGHGRVEGNVMHLGEWVQNLR